MINNVKKVPAFKNWGTEQVALKACTSAWLVSARRIYMRRKGTRTPSATGIGLSGLCPEPQDICKRFEKASRIIREGLKKRERQTSPLQTFTVIGIPACTVRV